MTNTGLEQLILGCSAPIVRLRALVARLAPTGLPILVEGPTGAGKELVARGLHLLGNRRGPFVAFNVCAISESMFESTLFGHVRGAFTGAHAATRGYLAEADGGTLFMDEIGALSPALQPKLLRAIETGEFRPIGSPSDRRSDFRLVVATNEAIPTLVQAGRFRPDLAHRISATLVRVPPLRDRPEDILVLALHFLDEARRRHGIMARLSEGAKRALENYAWPGNVRELRGVIFTAAVQASNCTISVDELSQLLERRRDSPVADGSERRRLLDVLGRVDGNVKQAAHLLGVNPVTVYRWMKRLGISPRDWSQRGLPSDGARSSAPAVRL